MSTSQTATTSQVRGDHIWVGQGIYRSPLSLHDLDYYAARLAKPEGPATVTHNGIVLDETGVLSLRSSLREALGVSA